MRDDMGERHDPYEGPLDLPDQYGPVDDDQAPTGPSLVDEIGSLFEDGKTYLEAELAFQKSRAAFAAGETKMVLAYGIGALILVHLGLIALSVGLVLALMPLVGAWGATAIVAGLLLLGALFLALRLKNRLGHVAAAFSESER